MVKDSMRIQAKIKDGVTEVKMLIKHPMETGARKEEATGKLIPAHFIKELTCKHKDRVVMSTIWSGGISKNPYCAFKFKGAAAGDSINVTWKDNQGDTDSAQAEIQAG